MTWVTVLIDQLPTVVGSATAVAGLGTGVTKGFGSGSQKRLDRHIHLLRLLPNGCDPTELRALIDEEVALLVSSERLRVHRRFDWLNFWIMMTLALIGFALFAVFRWPVASLGGGWWTVSSRVIAVLVWAVLVSFALVGGLDRTWIYSRPPSRRALRKAAAVKSSAQP